MPATLEGVRNLEQRLEELTTLLRTERPATRDWRTTFGLSRDDAGFDEMTRLGRQYRASAEENTNGSS